VGVEELEGDGVRDGRIDFFSKSPSLKTEELIDLIIISYSISRD
jgi:hypothetical protein